MNQTEQLERIAAVVPPNRVRIFSIDRQYQMWSWLCPSHLAARVADGWIVKETKEPPHVISCDDCRREART